MEYVRFVRWQRVAITQLGFLNNTVLALATASAGFALARPAPDSGWKLCLLWLGLALLSLSIIVALACALNRLWDFRETAQIAKGTMSDSETAVARREVERLGNRTWTLLYCQLASFVVGVMSLALVFGPFAS